MGLQGKKGEKKWIRGYGADSWFVSALEWGEPKRCAEEGIRRMVTGVSARGSQTSAWDGEGKLKEAVEGLAVLRV